MLNAQPRQYPVGLWCLRLLVPFIPLIMLIGMVRWQWNASVTDFHLVWSDEIINWHQVGGFREASFNTGYYSVWETAAPAAFTHFHVHGPWYPAFYGTLAHFLEWHEYTAVLINTFLLTLSLMFFVWGMRLNTWQTLTLGGVLVAAYAMHLYVSTTMQESFNQAIAVLVAMVFYVAFRKQERLSLPQKIMLGGFLFVAAIARMSWGILLLPYFLLIAPKTVRGMAIALVGFVIFGGLAFAIIQMTTPPGNHAIFATLDRMTATPLSAVQQIIDKFFANLATFLNRRVKPRLDVLQTAHVLFTVGVAGLMIVWNLVAARGKRDLPQRLSNHRWQLTESLFHFYNLVAVIFLSLIFYIIATWGDYRVIYGHLLVTLLLLILFKRYWLVWLIVITSLIVFPTFVTTYQELVGPKYQPTRNVTEAAAEFQTLMPYDAHVSNAWCNTVVVHIDDADFIRAVPLGIGTSIYFSLPAQPVKLKSQYFLLTPDAYDTLMNWTPAPRLEALYSLETVTLYRNLDAENCSAPNESAVK